MTQPSLVPSADAAQAPGALGIKEGITEDVVEDALSALMAAVHARVPFGPGFFSMRLRAFVRSRCPDPSEALPIVEFALDTGELIDACHVIGLAPLWIALAARDAPRLGEAAMRTELAPYAAIHRVTIRPVSVGGVAIGFDHEHRPALLVDVESSPEATLDRAARVDSAKHVRAPSGPPGAFAARDA